jgi:hypothetical protein
MYPTSEIRGRAVAKGMGARPRSLRGAAWRIVVVVRFFFLARGFVGVAPALATVWTRPPLQFVSIIVSLVQRGQVSRIEAERETGGN